MPSKPKVYVETTIPSYLTAWPSSEPVMAGHQKMTQDWWPTAPTHFDLYVSELVMIEIRRGDPAAAARRVAAVASLPVLAISPEITELARVYEAELRIPPKASSDAAHIAMAVLYEMDYFATWNCAHLANAHVLKTLRELNDQLGLFQPIIVTPESL